MEGETHSSMEHSEAASWTHEIVLHPSMQSGSNISSRWPLSIRGRLAGDTMMNYLSNKTRSVLLASVLAIVGVGQLSPMLHAADSAAEKEKERIKFDNKISFYG